MKRLVIILILILFTQNFCAAQFKKQLDKLCIVCNNATSDSDKVIALGKIADLYYTYQLNRQGDSVLHDQLLTAELSENNNLVLLALFGPAITNISKTASTESFDKTVSFLQKGIDFAKSQNQYNYVSLGFTRLASVLRKRGQNDKALYSATQALQILPNVKDDSIKAVIYIELGNCYIERGEAVSAVQNFNNAFDIALKLKSIPLQCEIYHCFAEMYYVFLDNKDIAKDFLKKSLKVDKDHNYIEGLIRDYFDLSRVTDERTYLQKSIALSDSFHYDKYALSSKKLLYAYYMVVDKNSGKALHYLESEPDLKESYKNSGIGNYYRTIGEVYLFADKPDSALTYFKLAENDFIKNFDEKQSAGLFREMAESYQKLHDVPNAIAYYTKVSALNKRLNNSKAIAASSSSLSNLYEQLGDYKLAFEYAKQAKDLNDSLGKLSKARDIALLDVDRENRKHDEELREEAKKENNKRDVQYMAISIALCVIFIGMLVVGTFPVSKVTIKMLGYFFFISLFEFIVMIVDNLLLAKAVHGEPLKLWLIKIALIAMLVPVQHFLEHNLIKFLESRKLLEARTTFSFKKFWQNIKKPAPLKEAGIEEDTAVL